MNTLLLIAVLAAPPQAPPLRATVPPQAPALKQNYADFFKNVNDGIDGVLLVNKPKPAGLKYPMHAATTAEIKQYSLESGVWLCRKDSSGRAAMDRLDAPATAAKSIPKSTSVYTDPPGYHRHKCSSCGTVWSHGAGGNVSHACPSCGREQLYHYEGYDPPSVSKPKAAPAKPKRVNFGGKYYDLFADGTLRACDD